MACLAGLKISLTAAMFFAAAASVFALGPHEVAVIVNERSVESVLMGRSYCSLRGIPECNLIRLDIPREVYDPASEVSVSPEEFTKYIWEPIAAGLKENGIHGQVLAYVFSCAFPARVDTQPAISLTGAVFLRGKFADPSEVQNGTASSPLFSGPFDKDGEAEDSASFDRKRAELMFSMPMPAMMLAFTGINGVPFDAAMASLTRSAGADATFPSGTFYFHITDDVRTECRVWQFEKAAELIRQCGAKAEISTNAPSDRLPIAGYMTGSRTASPGQMNILPGAFCDNLTSFGAAFDRREHTKATEWLKYGAAASAGTVTEPYALWTKFPNAVIFKHMLSGCTAIESIYQSVKCPLQLLPVGDPLCAPWAPRPEVSIVSEAEGKLSGTAEFSAAVPTKEKNARRLYTWLVDGKQAASGGNFRLDTRELPDGYHTVRLIVRQNHGTVRIQNYSEIRITTANP